MHPELLLRRARPTVVVALAASLVMASPPRRAVASPGVARWVAELPGVDPPAGPRSVALTFDDGPDPWAVPQVLDVLRRYGVTATFFMTGAAAAGNPGLVEAIARDGHVVAGHGWTHADMTKLSGADLASSVRRTDDVLRDLTGRTPPCVRPPYGAVSAGVVTRLERLGKTATLWTVDPRDWAGPGVAAIESRVLENVRPGAVVLLHPGSGVRAQTVEALPTIIEGLRARGYSFVSVCGTGTDVRSVVLGDSYGDAPAWPGQPIASNTVPVGAAPTPSGRGAWVAAADGGVFTFGDAIFAGSMGSTHLNAPVVAMASTASGLGYWLAASDGGVFSFGDAPFAGSTGAMRLNAPVVGMARPGAESGYWLVASDGGVFSFGGAPFLGSLGSVQLRAPVVGMAATPSGLGYWLVAADGGVFAFGDAVFAGSLGGATAASSAVSLAPSASGRGYWLARADGVVVAFGDAPALDSRAWNERWEKTVAVLQAGAGCWVVHQRPAVRPA